METYRYGNYLLVEPRFPSISREKLPLPPQIDAYFHASPPSARRAPSTYRAQAGRASLLCVCANTSTRKRESKKEKELQLGETAELLLLLIGVFRSYVNERQINANKNREFACFWREFLKRTGKHKYVYPLIPPPPL